mmetsp:Transcript_83058/g.131385  ORF Transcript_83058/g.131385 Transcript_83058/m.131385 type:complete len:217 (+) Transcript_83058:192-842(+)
MSPMAWAAAQAAHCWSSSSLKEVVCPLGMSSLAIPNRRHSSHPNGCFHLQRSRKGWHQLQPLHTSEAVPGSYEHRTQYRERSARLGGRRVVVEHRKQGTRKCHKRWHRLVEVAGPSSPRRHPIARALEAPPCSASCPWPLRPLQPLLSPALAPNASASPAVWLVQEMVSGRSPIPKLLQLLITQRPWIQILLWIPFHPHLRNLYAEHAAAWLGMES